VTDPRELREAVYGLLTDPLKERFERNFDVDFSHEFFGERFRINLHRQEGNIGLAARLIPSVIPRPEELGFNETIYNFTHLHDGLILVVGPTGSGKSTTLAGMLDIINQERRAHIVTIEDPIEYLFKEKQSIIEQRELDQDTTSFASALKYALRQDPNVIMVGEMRDLETISAALTAAETGHLVISTLHTATAMETIERIVDVFPENQQKQIITLLSTTLRVVIAQQLLPKIGGGRVAAREIMVNNRAISNLIQTGKWKQIESVIQTNRKEGMMTMDKSIQALQLQGLITKDTARNRTRDVDTSVAYY
jgi:twitching motility protein PilT